MKKHGLLGLLVSLGLLMGLSPVTGAIAQGPTTQLVMILDGSGSIDMAEWDRIVEGLASAIENPGCLPHDGSVELTVVQFGHPDPINAVVEVPPTVIAGTATASAVAATVRAMIQGEGLTPMAHGIHLAADTVAASPNFDLAIKQALNLTTDGDPNECDPTWPCPDEQTNAVSARNYAISTLAMTEAQDEFDAEGIGISDENRDWLRDGIVFPQPGHSVPPETWPVDPGWVRVVADAARYAETICEKIAKVVPDLVEECYCCSAGDSIYRIDGSSFYGYTTYSASGSPLIRVTSPPAPLGWNQPAFAPDSSWQPASEIWWDDWVASWAPLPGDGDCRPIGLRDEYGNQEAQSGTTHLYRRKFTLSPPQPGMQVTQTVLEMWSDNKTEWWWEGDSVSYGREGYIGQVDLLPGHVGPHGGTYVLAVQNSNDRVSHHNPQGTACRLCVTWVVPSALSYQVYLPLILKAQPFSILSPSP